MSGEARVFTKDVNVRRGASVYEKGECLQNIPPFRTVAAFSQTATPFVKRRSKVTAFTKAFPKSQNPKIEKIEG